MGAQDQELGGEEWILKLHNMANLNSHFSCGA